MTDTDTDTWETETEEDNMAKTKTETKYDEVLFDNELVDNLPPAAGSIYAEIVGKLIEHANVDEFGWLGVSTGGRAPNSVQTGLQSAARSLGVKVKTRTRPEDDEKKVYVALRVDEDDDGAEEEE